MRQKIVKNYNFKGSLSLNKTLGGFWEQVFLSFSRKKARFIFVFLIFLIVKFFDFLGGFFKFFPRKTPVISLKIPRSNIRADSSPSRGTTENLNQIFGLGFLFSFKKELERGGIARLKKLSTIIRMSVLKVCLQN